MSSPRLLDLTIGSIPRHIFFLSIPMIWGVLSVVSMQVADVYFISGLGQTALEAVSFTFPVSMVIFNLSMGFPIATSAICARLIGARRLETLKHFIAHTLVIGALTGLFFALIGEVLMPFIFPRMGAQAEHLPLIYSFMRISLWGYLFIILPMISNSAMRAAGDTLFPSFGMILAAVINIPLSWALVYGHGGLPALGMTGAAVANVTAYAFSALFSFFVLIVRHRLLDGYSFSAAHFFDSLRRLMSIALPVGIMNLFPPLFLSIITTWLSTYGAAAVAAYGVITRIDALATVPLMAFSTGLTVVIGQNYGAGRWDRIEHAIQTAILFFAVWSGFIGLMLMGFGPALTRYFTDAPDILAITRAYFLTIGLSIVTMNITLVWGSTWNALGRPRYSAVITFGRFVTLLVFCGGMGHLLGQWQGLFWGLTAGNLIGGLTLHFWSLRQLRLIRS